MKSIFSLKSKFIKHLKNKEISSEFIANTIHKIIKEDTSYKTEIQKNKYDNQFYTYVFNDKKCYCIEIVPINFNRKLKESMIDIIEVPYNQFIKDGKLIN